MIQFKVGKKFIPRYLKYKFKYLNYDGLLKFSNVFDKIDDNHNINYKISMFMIILC